MLLSLIFFLLFLIGAVSIPVMPVAPITHFKSKSKLVYQSQNSKTLYNTTVESTLYHEDHELLGDTRPDGNIHTWPEYSLFDQDNPHFEQSHQKEQDQDDLTLTSRFDQYYEQSDEMKPSVFTREDMNLLSHSSSYNPDHPTSLSSYDMPVRQNQNTDQPSAQHDAPLAMDIVLNNNNTTKQTRVNKIPFSKLPVPRRSQLFSPTIRPPPGKNTSPTIWLSNPAIHAAARAFLQKPIIFSSLQGT